MNRKEKAKKELIEILQWTFKLSIPKFYSIEKPITNPRELSKEVLIRIDNFLYKYIK